MILITVGGFGANFVHSLIQPNQVLYTEEINEYNCSESNYYDYKTNKMITFISKIDYSGRVIYHLFSKTYNVLLFVHALGFIKDACGVKFRGNYEQNKLGVLKFNRKYGVHINPYSSICNQYFKQFDEFNEKDFKRFIRIRFELFVNQNVSSCVIKPPRKRPKPIVDIYYEDIFFNLKTNGTMFEGHEERIKEYTNKNLELIKRYQQVLDISDEFIAMVNNLNQQG